MDEVNGAYEVLVKVSLRGEASAADAQLRDHRIRDRSPCSTARPSPV